MTVLSLSLRDVIVFAECSSKVFSKWVPVR